jgi:hypothetical protein
MQLGQIVFYTLEAHDVQEIQRQRRLGRHLGNALEDQQTFPAMIVKISQHEFGYNHPGVNLRVFLDGSDFLWATSRIRDERGKPGTWRLQEKAQAALQLGT